MHQLSPQEEVFSIVDRVTNKEEYVKPTVNCQPLEDVVRFAGGSAPDGFAGQIPP